MSDYSTLKAAIDANIRANGNQEITGQVMNSVLNQMVDDIQDQTDGQFTELESHANDINISAMFPTGGTDGTNIYTTTNARRAVPSSLRKLGMTLTYLTSEDELRVERYDGIATDDTSWIYGVWPKINEYPIVNINSLSNEDFTDASEARKKLSTSQRKSGVIITYRFNGNWIIEQFIGDTWTTVDSAWERLATLSKVEEIETEVQSISSQVNEISGNVNNILSTIYNVSLLHPTGGTDGTNIYTTTNARRAVPSEYRNSGLILVYKTTDGVVIEQYIGATDDTSWVYGNGWINYNAIKYININEITGIDIFDNRDTALKAVPRQLRVKGLIVTYITNDGVHTERFIGDSWSYVTDKWEEFVVLNNIKDFTYKEGLLLVNKDTYINADSYRSPSFDVDTILTTTEKGTILVDGIDCKVTLYDDEWRGLASYIVNNNEETEIIIPKRTSYIIVATIDGETLSERIDFNIQIHYDTILDKYDRYQQVLYERKVTSILRNLKRTTLVSGLPDTSYDNLVLSCITDIHGDEHETNLFVDFCKKMRAYIDDKIGLGDYVSGAKDDENYNLDSITGFQEVLKTVGNHDAYHHWDGGTYDYVDTDESVYDKFYRGFIENWGVVYQEGKCFYYKDYDKQHIRLVCLDYMHWDDETDYNGQKEWLTNILINNADSALNKGYHVVITCHCPIYHSNTGNISLYENSAFTSKDYKFSEDVFDGSSILNIVNSFQSQGGDFACYIFGHMHKSFVGYYENYPNQIFIAQPLTSGRSTHNDKSWSTDCPWELCFNIYGFDYKMKYIKVYQVGESYDRNMQHMVSLCLTYNKDVENKLLYTT